MYLVKLKGYETILCDFLKTLVSLWKSIDLEQTGTNRNKPDRLETIRNNPERSGMNRNDPVCHHCQKIYIFTSLYKSFLFILTSITYINVYIPSQKRLSIKELV